MINLTHAHHKWNMQLQWMKIEKSESLFPKQKSVTLYGAFVISLVNVYVF